MECHTYQLMSATLKDMAGIVQIVEPIWYTSMDWAELVCDMRVLQVTWTQTNVFTRTGHWSCTDLKLQCSHALI
jgi:hypothetical protein